jgi:hypothetical protein
MRVPILLVVLAMMNGCADTYTEPLLPNDHPANPSAPAAPAMERARTLDLGAMGPTSGAPGSTGADRAAPGAGEALRPAGGSGGSR